MAVPYIPDGMHAVIPYMMTADARALIAFITATFDGEVADITERPDGTVMHADLRVGDSVIMLGQPTDPSKAQPSSIYVYVPDTDAAYRKGLAAGGTPLMEPADQFYGDRNAGVLDPLGNTWWIGTHVEDVPPDEMERRAAEAAKTG